MSDTTPPREPTPAMLKAAHDLVHHERFSPRLRYKMQNAGAGMAEIWKAMYDAGA